MKASAIPNGLLHWCTTQNPKCSKYKLYLLPHYIFNFLPSICKGSLISKPSKSGLTSRMALMTIRRTMAATRLPCKGTKWSTPDFAGCVKKNLVVAAKFPNRYMINGQLGADRGMSLELFLKSMTSTRSYSPVKHMLEPWKSWDCFMGILIPVLSVVELVAPCVLNMYNMHGEYFQMWFSLFPSMVYIQCQIQNNQHIAYQESPHLCLMYRLYNHLWFPFNPCRRSSCPRSAS